MIRFFRTIRKKLATENKFMAYSRYAIGEIVLVVIGILIALQINNWNEERKRNQEISISLYETKSNLIADSLSIHNTKTILKEDLFYQNDLIKILDKNQLIDASYHKHLGRIVLMRRINFVENGYNMLKKMGLENIKQTHLRNLIIEHYDNTLYQLQKDIDDDEDEFKNLLLPYIRKNFVDWKFSTYGIPKNYIKISRDPEFKIMLKVNYQNRQSTLNRLNNSQEEIRELIALIEKY